MNDLDCLITICVIALIALCVGVVNLTLEKKKKARRLIEEKNLRDKTRPVIGQAYKFTDDPNLEFIALKVDDEEGQVGGTLVIYLPAGAIVDYANFEFFSEIEIRYSIKTGEETEVYVDQFDANPNPEGLEAWRVWYKRPFVIKSR